MYLHGQYTVKRRTLNIKLHKFTISIVLHTVLCYIEIGGGCLNTQFKRGIIELCVLSVLADEDLYGYAVIQRLAEHIDVKDNTIYPILRRLSKEGYFETVIRESSEGAARKYYQMTKKGFAYYVSLRDRWDAFIGGVYAIITQKGEKDGTLFKRLARRFEEAEDGDT